MGKLSRSGVNVHKAAGQRVKQAKISCQARPTCVGISWSMLLPSTGTSEREGDVNLGTSLTLFYCRSGLADWGSGLLPLLFVVNRGK